MRLQQSFNPHAPRGARLLKIGDGFSPIIVAAVSIRTPREGRDEQYATDVAVTVHRVSIRTPREGRDSSSQPFKFNTSILVSIRTPREGRDDLGKRSTDHEEELLRFNPHAPRGARR